MSDLAQRLAGLSPVQRQLLEQRLAKSRQATPEAIALVGMACRFPGSPSLRDFWRLIREAKSAVVEVPPERWSLEEFYDATGEAAGKMSVRWAALIEGPDQFDPQFFGITPREASRMDPQQRLLLEVAWEAMENAGRAPDQMAGSRTGVFIGIGGTDYSKVVVPYDDYYQHIDAHMGTGNALSIAANRLSYIFDFRGPSAAVDTACSSSSLAIHMAVESLRRGESDAALAGGVNMILTPETTIAFSKARMLSPDGVCRPFDARANGYVRGEGCGLVLLKRLADAQRDGDRVLAVLRATSVNQDGRTSGISAPNGQSQMACIRAALQQAGLTPDDIDYIEAHGTGTPLGDPIEMQALGEIFRARGEGERPCYVSSVKANVGHMETVSGVAGLIKVALMMKEGVIARQAQFKTLNPHMSLDGTRLVIPTEAVEWADGGRPRRAGVSSFGFGGTNTHLIVEAPAEEAATGPQATERPVHLLKFSAKSEAALKAQAARLADYLDEGPEAAVADVCWSANTGRTDFSHRAVIAASDAGQLRQRVGALAGGEAAAGLKQHVVRALGRPKVAFLFTGQGSQYVGMGRGLYETQPAFRGAVDECDAVLRELWGGESLLDVMYPAAEAASPKGASPKGDVERLDQTRYTQPALFALEYALAQLWASWGVVPDIVLGHSVGEYAAACVVGVMGLEDGLRLIAERARLMQSVKRPGKMAVVFAPAERVARATAACGGEVVIAVLNGPENTVISGEAGAVDAATRKLVADGLQVTPLNVSHAFHSPLMDEMLGEFEEVAGRIAYHAPHVPLAANLTGQLMREAPTSRYWRDHLRNAVQFAEGMARVAEAVPQMIVEIGPTASLLGMGRRCLPKLEAAWLASLREGQDDWQVIGASVSEFYVRGGQIDWRGWDRFWHRRRLMLPTYAFQRSRHWYQLEPSRRRVFAVDGDGTGVGIARGATSGHALLGAALSTVWSNRLYETRLSAASPAYLNDHQVQGSPVAPAAAYLEQALAAAGETFGAGQHAVKDFVVQQAMYLPEGARRRVQISVAPESNGVAAMEVYSRPAEEEPTSEAWTLHASGSLVHQSPGSASNEVAEIDLQAVRDRAVSVTARDEFYSTMRERGLNYGPAFQVLDELHRGADEAVARIELPEAVRRELARYRLHPALGDALLQLMAGVVPIEEDGSYSPFTYMPVGIRAARLAAAGEALGQPLFVYAKRTSADDDASPEIVEADVYLADESGTVLGTLEGVRIQRIGRGRGADSVADTSGWLYRVGWRKQSLAENGHQARSGAWLILADERGVGSRLADELGRRGEASVLVRPGARFEASAGGSTNGEPLRQAAGRVDPLNESDYAELLHRQFLAKGRSCLGVVHLWSLDMPATVADDAEGDAWRRVRALGCGSALQLVRAMAGASLDGSARLCLVTAGAQAVSGVDGVEQASLAVLQSPLLGFGRVAAMELPDLRSRMVDVEAVDSAPSVESAAAALAAELTSDSDEGEVAYRGGERLVARLERAPSLLEDAAENADSGLPVPRGPYQLRITQTGSLDALRLVPVEREPPAAGQVELEVKATGLNFSDVLKALGLYPGIKDAIVPLGIEASGIVTAVGEGVTRFGEGDEVFGVVPYAFASHARSAEYALVHKPKPIGHEEACTIPITFLTAYYGLVRLAQLQPGERVLIHAGAGGVGLAAIQVAKKIGAEIFATAGSDAKRDILRSLGVEHVYSSRSVAFAEEILADTRRQGVDVVLNSLPGEAISKSLSILRAYGRFLEIGKTDIYQNRMIGLLPFQDNLSYFAIDLDRMLRQRPDYIRELFAEVMRHFEAGDYAPLAFTRFAAAGTVEAFRYMSQRKNVGKVVVSIADCQGRAEWGGRSERDSKAEAEIGPVRGDGTYLLTGGLGGLGLRVAKWLAEQGAGTIVLLSRRGASAETSDAVAAIREKGSEVVVLAGDVADAKSLAAALASLPASVPPLRGVIHAAGVLADGIITTMTLDQLERAMAPKVRGAWNLHRATLDAPLDFFVLFSSVASVLGSPGQANYAAGNAYLDGLAHARRRQGRPATAINWGPWAGSGMAAEAGRGAQVKSRGMALLEPHQGLELLGKALRSKAAQLAVMDAQWADVLRLAGSRRPSLLAEIAAEVEQSGGAGGDSRVDHAFRAQLLETDESSRQALIGEYIRQELARIIGVEPATLAADQPLSTFGLDSLLALELKNHLEGRLDFTLPMSKLMEGPSVASLAAETSRLLATADTASTAGQRGSGKEGEAWTPILSLRATGSRPPLVLLPALGGDVRCYAQLTQQLGPEQPVYAFRPRGVDQDLPPHLTMNEMIADYVAALRELQPTGPYYIAGWSTGGIFAHALAEALEHSGEEVGLLVMVDTPLPSLLDDVDVEDDAKFLCDILNYTNRFAGTDLRFSYGELPTEGPQERFRHALAEARRQGLVPAETPESFIRRLVGVGEANVRVIQGYSPGRVAAPVVLFVPTVKTGLAEVSGRATRAEEDLGWSADVGQAVRVEEVAGDHFTMLLNEGASQLAASLRRHLESAGRDAVTTLSVER